MSTVHDELEMAALKLNAAIVVLVDAWYGAGGWVENEDGRWTFLALLERALGHLEAGSIRLASIRGQCPICCAEVSQGRCWGCGAA